MANVHGKNSTLKITDVGSTLRDFSTHVSNIQLNLSGDSSDASAFSQNYKSALGGQYGGTLTFDFIYDATFAGYLSALFKARTITPVEYSVAGDAVKYSFTALITDFNPASSVSDIVKGSVSMLLSGDYTLA